MKIKLLSVLALSTVILGACSSATKHTDSSKAKTEQTAKQVEKEPSVDEKVTKDAKILLDAVLSKDSVKFRKIYGETYDKWSDDIIAVQTNERINDDGLKPASAYTVQWHKDFPVETPEETISGFLKVRRKMFQDIGSYSIKDVKVDKSGDSATVTFTSKKLHSKGLAGSTREVLTTVLGGLDNLAKYNTAGADVDVKRYQKLITYWIFEHLFTKQFSIYKDVDASLAQTPFTSGEFDTEIKLTKDKDDNWVISQEDYQTLTSELIDDTESYDTIVRANSTTTKTQKTQDKDSV